MAVTWAWDEAAGRVFGVFTPGDRHAGYAQRMHGGLLTTLLDECMAWAAAMVAGSYCTTGDLQVRFKIPARIGEELTVAGWSETSWGPYVRTRGKVTANGATLATASATFAAMPRAEALALRAALTFTEHDIDVLAR
jgi:acyl-CoA hydrolase